MKHLDLYDVLAVAAGVWRVDADAAIRRTDLEAVELGLAAARMAYDEGRIAEPLVGLAEALAALLVRFVQDRPFEGANRMVTVAVLLQCAGQNGRDLQLEPVDQLDRLIDRIRSGLATGPEIVESLRARLCAAPPLGEPTAPGDIQFDFEEGHMFEKFTDRARRVMVLAQEEARLLQHDYIGTEHVLIAIAHEGEGIAAKVLANVNVSETTARAVVIDIVGQGDKKLNGHIPFTPRCKRVLEYSLREALQLGNNYIDTEHLLLGIIQDGEGVATQVLVRLGADPTKLRQQISARQRSEAAVSEFLAGDGEDFLLKMPGRRHHLLGELENLLDENDRLYEQVRRLREKLRQHDIDPDS
jgi:hypothetical protein